MTAIWISRSQPGATQTADRVAALGHEPVVAPVLELRELPAEVSLGGVAAVAFTSANAVRLFAERTPERRVQVFTVGDATARAAKGAGFRTVLSADGDVAALGARIAARARDLQGGVVLHPGAAEPAGDLVGDLTRAGVAAKALPLYASVPARMDEGFLARLPSLTLALAHSPAGARRMAELLRSHPAPGLTVLCLSAAVARPLSRARSGGRIAATQAAPHPNEAALIDLIR